MYHERTLREPAGSATMPPKCFTNWERYRSTVKVLERKEESLQMLGVAQKILRIKWSRGIKFRKSPSSNRHNALERCRKNPASRLRQHTSKMIPSKYLTAAVEQKSTFVEATHGTQGKRFEKECTQGMPNKALSLATSQRPKDLQLYHRFSVIHAYLRIIS